jgi:beta-N-acetylhexosaminidase
LCGQLLVVGITGETLTGEEVRRISEGRCAGIILFKRNVGNIDQVIALNRAIHEAGTPLVAIDQEGGRVARIGPPALVLPPMREIGDRGDVDFAATAAEAQGRELAAMGFTVNFAPVADIHTQASNPVIGNRSFGTTAEVVTKFARAWATGLDRSGIASCLKHFPGHGDTTVDSHLALPRVDRDRAGLDAIELAPFRALAKDETVSSMMVAHVVFTAIAETPASLTRAICTDLLRRELGFEGTLFSDDLEMKAIAIPVPEAALRAIDAGCDIALICHRGDFADEAHATLVKECEKSPAFLARCREAAARSKAIRTRRNPVNEDALERAFELSAAVVSRMRG